MYATARASGMRHEKTKAVKEALPKMRFSAARVGGRKVQQLVQLPFEFHINR